jgi:predicted transcriptional regulator
MSAQLVAKAIGKQLRQTQTILTALVEHGILYREKDGRPYVYGVNDRYHSMGSVVKGANFTKLYQTRTRTDIANISIQSAGVLYKMMPFFNYAHYYLSENPSELDASKIRHLSHRSFAEMVNVSRNTINDAMRELRRNGFIMSVESYGGQLYRINPDVMFRKKDEYDEYTQKVREDFEALRRNVEQNGETTGIDFDELPY